MEISKNPYSSPNWLQHHENLFFIDDKITWTSFPEVTQKQISKFPWAIVIFYDVWGDSFEIEEVVSSGVSWIYFNFSLSK